MQFLQHQQSGRRAVRRLTASFAVLCVAGLLAMSFMATAVVIAALKGDLFSLYMLSDKFWDRMLAEREFWNGFIWVTLAAGVGLIGVLRSLESSFESPTQRLVGRLGCLKPDDSLEHRRLRNVVEEVALACRTPAPSVYIRPDNVSINAFVVGYGDADAAIIVTQRALMRLKRDELQAVVAHCMSRILNGDGLFNLRLSFYLSALFWPLRAGLWLLIRPFTWPRHGLSRRAILLLMFGGLPVAFVLTAVGVAYSVLGPMFLYRAARERIRLADACVPQITLDPSALKNALLKIAALSMTKDDTIARAVDAGPMAFVALRHGVLFDTHPSLFRRLRRIHPQFTPSDVLECRRRVAMEGQLRARDAREPPREERAPEHTAPSTPAFVIHAAEEGIGVVLALLFSHDAAEREAQRGLIRDALGANDAAEATRRYPAVLKLAAAERISALRSALPVLRGLTAADGQALLKLIGSLAIRDSHVSVLEYALQRTTLIFLRDYLKPGPVHGSDTLKHSASSLQVLFSVVAQHGHRDPVAARRAFEAGISRLLPHDRPSYSPLVNWASPLSTALTHLERLQPAAKEMLLEALTTTAEHDSRKTPDEGDLISAIALSLHCPASNIEPPAAASVQAASAPVT